MLAVRVLLLVQVELGVPNDKVATIIGSQLVEAGCSLAVGCPPFISFNCSVRVNGKAPPAATAPDGAVGQVGG